MTRLTKSTIQTPDTADNDPRIAHFLERGLSDSKPKAVIIGFPSDVGVKRNGGRPGASEAPDKIRQQLYKMTPDAEKPEVFTKLIKNTKDVGNLETLRELASDQEDFGEILGDYLSEGIIPIILGGGHETAFAHYSGYAEAELSTSILNIDAHTDVRPLKDGKPHSGSSFKQALEHNNYPAKKYLVAGLQPHRVAQSHLKFIDEHDGSYLFRDETNVTSISGLFHEHSSEHLMVTFDMDAVDQSQAPGVSAPCSNGLPADLWLMAAYLAGRNKKVTSFDLSEVNPKYDRDGQTLRLAALTVWNFLLGLSQRD